MIQPSFFWTGCKRTYELKLTSVSGIIGNVFVKDFTDIQSSLSTIYFPFCHREHWYVGVIDLKGQRIQVADSLDMPPPPNFVRALLYVLGIAGINTSEWSPVWERLPCPIQQDGHSCGVAALSFIQSRCADSDITGLQWSPQNSDIYRLRWLEQIVSHHDPVEYPCDTANVSPFIRMMAKVLSVLECRLICKPDKKTRNNSKNSNPKVNWRMKIFANQRVCHRSNGHIPLYYILPSNLLQSHLRLV